MAFRNFKGKNGNVRTESLDKVQKRQEKQATSYNEFFKGLAPTRPYGGKFLKIGNDYELLLTNTAKKDDNGNTIYVGTLMKRKGLLKNKVEKASHIAVKKF